MEKIWSNAEIEFVNKAIGLVNEMIKKDIIEIEFTCPTCGEEAKVIRVDPKERKGEFVSYCKCGKRIKGAVIL